MSVASDAYIAAWRAAARAASKHLGHYLSWAAISWSVFAAVQIMSGFGWWTPVLAILSALGSLFAVGWLILLIIAHERLSDVGLYPGITANRVARQEFPWWIDSTPGAETPS